MKKTGICCILIVCLMVSLAGCRVISLEGIEDMRNGTQNAAAEPAQKENDAKEASETAQQEKNENEISIPDAAEVQADVSEEGTEPADSVSAEETEEVPSAELALLPLVRPSILSGLKESLTVLNADVPSYSVEGDYDNVRIPAQLYLQDRAKEDLTKYLFHIDTEGSKEFFEVYEKNRYNFIPSFVTTDSMMHTYHLYFSLLLKNTEKNYLSDNLKELSVKMLEKSSAQLDALRGTEWETAAMRNTAFFAVGAALLNQEVGIPADIADLVEGERSLIAASEGMDESPMLSFGSDDPVREDYSQYIVRGYYEGDEELERYFRAMMWFGRMNFYQKTEDLDRSALLMTLALDDETLPLWDGIYTVTAFFAGASDDNGYYEYRPVIDAVYGENAEVSDLIGNDDAWQLFHTTTGSLPGPRINSVVNSENEEEMLGFRFMGQRFSIDAAIFEKLIYSEVGKNSDGENRMLPDALDIPAAMGSDEALGILDGRGAADYSGYSENMKTIRGMLQNADDSLWNASLYSKWLNTLTPLTNEEREGWPSFMQSSQWARKDLQTYLGSYAELKHDTVLYSKQSMPEMGGNDIIEEDDRGYVEPEPVLYERLAALTQATAEGLKGYGMLSPNDEESLSRLSELALSLETISIKELNNETPTEQEFELIRGFGGSLEHFWKEAYRDEPVENLTTLEFPAAVVTDIATDANSGTVLEVGTGYAGSILVVVPVDGKLTIARGAVYSFYEFEWPMSDRLTDTQWREMMGIQRGADGNYSSEPAFKTEDWTSDFQSSWRDN